VSYQDVGSLCAEAVTSARTSNTTFEVYYQPRRGVSAPPFLVQPGSNVAYQPQLRGYTWEQLFQRLGKDPS
jgi:hypothetical protein